MLWTLFYSRNLPKNREEHSCGTFWHSYLWCSCCLVFFLGRGGQRGAMEREEKGQRGWKRKMLRGDIRPEGIYSARQQRVDITSWETGQSISQPVHYSTIQKERCPSEQQWRIQDVWLRWPRWEAKNINERQVMKMSKYRFSCRHVASIQELVWTLIASYPRPEC